MRCPLLMAVVLLALVPPPGLAAEPIVGKYAPGTLENYLVGRLLVARADDAEFIEQVAESVRVGELPESVVRGTCEWSVLRATKRGVRYPFPYFRTAMPIKARHFGVEF